MSDKTKFRSIGVEADINALVTKETSDIAGQQSLLKDTVGWTGKNLIPLPYEFGNHRTQGGITAKTNADGSITFNGTVTASISFRLKGRSIHDDNYFLVKPGKYIFSCGNIENNFYWSIATTKNNSYSVIADGLHTSTYELTITSDMSDEAVDGAIPLATYANFRTLGDVYNNFTVYPMLRKADITDPTYEPYHESVEVMYEEEIHGVNLLTLKSFANAVAGLTATLNSDKSITINGTSTSTDNIYFSRQGASDATILDEGNYILSVGTIPSTCRLHLSYSATDGTNVTVAYGEYGNGNLLFAAPIGGRPWNVILQVKNNATLNNLKIYPMIRKATIDDPTYRPYNPQAIQNQLNAQGVLGAKNLLENVATSGTNNGITYTVNNNKSVTFVGTTTATSTFAITPDIATNKFLDDGNYILSTNTPLPTGTELWLNGYVNGAYYNHVATMTAGMKEVAFTVTPNLTGIKLYIQIPHIDGGRVVSSTTIYPMIRLASDPDDTYQPYAMTNRELTEIVNRTKLLGTDDLDTVFGYGNYYWENGIPLHSPENNTFCAMRVYPCGEVTHQEIIRGAGNSASIYLRRYQNTWSSWYKFTGTVVS